ncbi:uncharacterized protein TA15675 [Theileria annulata]|uniref:THO complex subunit 2 n=1 Tax=Theileria annulata TaxID=5874 RepID=Q4UFM1_THEAN|nr:uncharacterized protein TA15675 [Theileria annulata]CAI74095.1 hypothetical protein TA15675 [Theileria annulata]|eukprot:XP_951827.1 hypothetical protein TA15675 [Theileria annulata]
MEKGKPRIKRKSIDETEKEEPEKVNQKLQKEPQKNSKRKLDTDSKDEQHKNITTEGRRKSESLEVPEVSKSSRNPSQEKELESYSTNTDHKKTNHPNTNGPGGPDYKNTRLVESTNSQSNANSSKITSRTLSTESKRELYKNSQSMVDKNVLEMLENFEDEVDLTLFKFVSSVANGTINPVTSVDALRTKFHGVSKNSTLVFKVLDLVSFFLDDTKKRQNLLLFLESLENFGLVSSMEIISVIDPAKLDSCNYSEGLVKISIRERTKNNYVLKIYNLFRESYHGYTALSNYLSSLVDKHGRNGLRFDVVQRPKQAQNKLKELDPDTVVATVNKISGMYKLCPIRTLYEVLKWLVLTNHSDEFVMKILKSYPSKISYVVLLYLKNNYQNKDKLLRINNNKQLIKELEEKNEKNGKLDGKNGKLNEKNGKDEKNLENVNVNENLNGYSNDNIYKIVGMLISEKLLKIDVVYNYLDPSDELLSNISNHFLNILKTSPNKDTRDNLTIPIPLLKKLVTSHLNLNCLNPKYKRSTRMKEEHMSTRMKEEHMSTKLDKEHMSTRMKEEHMSTKLDKENKIRKTSLTLLENMINKYESNDYSILLRIDNYHYLKECIYLMESGKFLVLSTLLNQCTDFEGELWDICYSYILHLYTINYPIFLNTSVTVSLTNIMNKILNTSVVYRNIPEVSRGIDLDNELIIIKKLEYYLKFVGFRCSENIIMFNNILTYLQIILTKINKHTGYSSLSTVDSDLRSSDSNLRTKDSSLSTEDSDLKTCDSNLKTVDSNLKTRDSNLKTRDSNLQALNTEDKHLIVKRMIKKLLYKYIIFSIMNCCEGNFQISDRIWNILKQFTTLERYQIYSKTLQILNSKQQINTEKMNIEQINEKMETTGVNTNSEGVSTNSVGVSGTMNTEQRNKKIWNRLVNLYYNYQMDMIKKLYEGYNYKLKNIFKKITFELLKSIKSPTIRSIVSIITAISAINPFSVSILIIKQSELFNNLLLPLCELTKYFLSYTIDIFIYQLTINLIYLTNTSTNNTTGKLSSIIGTGTVTTNTMGTSSTMGTAGASTVTYMKEYSLSKNRLEDNNNIIEEENNKMYINSIILCKIYKRHTECDIIPIITILILLLNFSISNHLILCRTNQTNILNHTMDTGDTKDNGDSKDNEDSDGVGMSTKGVSTKDIKDGKDSKDSSKGSMSNVSTLVASTVTEGKGANSMGMECTTENNTNKIAIVTNSRESSTFSVDSKDTKEAPLGAVSTGCREPHSVTEIKIIGICIENYYNIIYIIYNVLDYLIRLIEIIGGMIDVDMNKMTQEQLLCQCGSYSLKNESITNLDEEINKKSLIKVICRPFFINSLVIVLGRLINELLYDSNFNNCKLLLSIVDKFNNLLILLINFLQLNQQTFLLPNKQLLMKFFTLNQLQFINTVKCTEIETTVEFTKPVTEDREPGSTVGSESTVEPKSTVGPKSTVEMKSTLDPKNTLQPKSNLQPPSSLDPKSNLQPPSSLDPKSSLDLQPLRFKRKLEFPTVDNILDDNFIGFINNLNIYDIYTPVEQYDNYITKLTSGIGNTVRRIKRIKNRITILETDKNEHIQHTNMILSHLKEVLKRFVKNDNKVGPHITMRFITRIIFPRLFVSELNALFCCKIVDTILENKMNYFNYFDFVNCYTKMLIPMISSLTEREVISLSIFFNHSFQLIKAWVNDRDAFEKLVYDNPCFCTTFKFQPNKEFKYQQLLQVIKKWEYFILLSIFSSVTGSGQTATNINKVNSTNNSNSIKDSSSTVVTSNKDSTSNKVNSSTVVTSTSNTKSTTTSNKDSNTKDSKANKDTNSIKGAPFGAGNKDSKSTSSTMGSTMGTTTGTAGASTVTGTVTDESPIVQSWIEIKNVIIFLNKVSNNFPITINSSLKVLNFLKNVLKLAKQNNWQDVTVSSNTLIKLIQMYQNQNKYITINIPNINTPGQTSTNSSNSSNSQANSTSNPITSTPTNTSTNTNTPNNPSKNTNETTSRRNSDTSPKISEETTKRNLEESTKGSDETTKRSSEESPKSNSKETTVKNSKETTPKNKSNETSPKKTKETTKTVSKELTKGNSKETTKGNSKEPTPRTTAKETTKTTTNTHTKTTGTKETPKTSKETPKTPSKDTPKSTTKETPKTTKAQTTT